MVMFLLQRCADHLMESSTCGGAAPFPALAKRHELSMCPKQQYSEGDFLFSSLHHKTTN